jgi:3-hydroxyacyl-CoA dehydrogenase
MAFMASFGEEVLGKGIVFGKDTTNFIANRIGVYGMMKTIQAAIAGGYSVEEVDKIFGPATGRPKSAVFRTADLVGLDTLVHVAQNCYDSLTDDEDRDAFLLPGFVQEMVAKGWLGDKSGQGFYKKSKDAAGKKAILSLNLQTLEYGEQGNVRIDSLGAVRKENDVKKRIKVVLNANDRAGELARAVTYGSLAYAARRLGEIADDIVNIDRGMRWGFNWELGPFETWDALGLKETAAKMTEAGVTVPAWVAQMIERGFDAFYREQSGELQQYDPRVGEYVTVPRARKEVSLDYLKKRGDAKRIKHKLSASLWDIGEGVLGLELHSALVPKMNPVDDDVISMLHAAVDELEENFDALVLYHDGENFSAGANLMMLFMGAQAGQWDQIRAMVDSFQQANQRLRFSSKPVVAAPAGLALGGGAEMVLGANAVQAAAELYIGLVEVGMGLIPGGGGTLNLLRKLMGPFSNDKDVPAFPYVQKAFMAIGMAQVATSAEEGREKGFLSQFDGVTLNRDHLLSAAKERALGMARAGFRAPLPQKFLLPGKDGAATIDMLLYSMVQNQQISDHDRLIGRKLGHVLTGGDRGASNNPVDEQYILELEQEAFLSLAGEKKTQERIGYFLQNSKPLRN